MLQTHFQQLLELTARFSTHHINSVYTSLATGLPMDVLGSPPVEAEEHLGNYFTAVTLTLGLGGKSEPLLLQLKFALLD